MIQTESHQKKLLPFKKLEGRGRGEATQKQSKPIPLAPDTRPLYLRIGSLADTQSPLRETTRRPSYMDDPRLGQSAKDELKAYEAMLERAGKEHQAWLDRQPKVPTTIEVDGRMVTPLQYWRALSASRDTERLTEIRKTIQSESRLLSQQPQEINPVNPQQGLHQPLYASGQTNEGGNTYSVLEQWEQIKRETARQAQEAVEKKKQTDLRAQRKKEQEAAMKTRTEAVEADPQVAKALMGELQDQRFDTLAQRIQQSWQGSTPVSLTHLQEQKASVLLKPIKPQDDEDYKKPVTYDKTFQERSKAGMKLSYSYETVDSKTKKPKIVTKDLSFGIGNFVTFEGESWELPDDFSPEKQQSVKAYFLKTPSGATWVVPVAHPEALNLFLQRLQAEAEYASPQNAMPKKQETSAKDGKKKPTFGAWHWISNRGILEYLLNQDFYDHAA